MKFRWGSIQAFEPGWKVAWWKVLALVLVGLGLGSLLFWFRAHKLVFYLDGEFRPFHVQVPVGGVVTFVNVSSESFWPASDLHPSHELYAEFDPLQPVAGGQSWSFQFQQPGVWTYHDHLRPISRGTVQVGAATNSCDGTSLACYFQELSIVTDQEGVSAALAKLRSWMEESELVRQNCHDLSHVIGEEAYQHYQQGENFQLSREKSLCGFGFYHGFIETVLSVEGSVSTVAAACRDLLDNPDILNTDQHYSACFHGIGHGVFDLVVASQDVSAGLESGLATCRSFSQNQQEETMCVTGVFNGLRFAYFYPQYDVEFNPDDPLELCHVFDESDRRWCYADVLAGYADSQQWTMAESYRFFVDRYSPTSLERAAVVNYLAGRHNRTWQIGDSVSSEVLFCQELPSELRSTCFEGLIGALAMQIPADQLFTSLEPVCEAPQLSGIERAKCYEIVIAVQASQSSSEQVAAVCQLLPTDLESVSSFCFAR